MPEREYYNLDEWLRAGGDPTYGQAVSPLDPYRPPAPAAGPGYAPWTDPDNAPPDLGNPNQQPSGDPGPGNRWVFVDGRWILQALPRGNNQSPVDPPPPPPPPPPQPQGELVGGQFGGGSSSQWPSYSMNPFDPGPAFSYRDFAAPNQQDVLNDQGFQFRMDQGRKALEASAAGRGVLRSGGTLKDILNYGQNFASQEYGNVYDRALTEYDTNRKNAWDSWSTGYTGRKDKYGFDQGNAQFGFNAQQRQGEFDRNEALQRWMAEGGWLKDLSVAGLE